MYLDCFRGRMQLAGPPTRFLVSRGVLAPSTLRHVVCVSRSCIKESIARQGQDLCVFSEFLKLALHLRNLCISLHVLVLNL